jgi:hypothetical protein
VNTIKDKEVCQYNDVDGMESIYIMSKNKPVQSNGLISQ